MPFIDIQDLKAYTNYTDYNKDSDIVKWLFEILEDYDEIMKANFL